MVDTFSSSCIISPDVVNTYAAFKRARNKESISAIYKEHNILNEYDSDLPTSTLTSNFFLKLDVIEMARSTNEESYDHLNFRNKGWKKDAPIYHKFLKGGKNSMKLAEDLLETVSKLATNDRGLESALQSYQNCVGVSHSLAAILSKRSKLEKEREPVALLVLWCAISDLYDPCSNCPTGNILKQFVESCGGRESMPIYILIFIELYLIRFRYL